MSGLLENVRDVSPALAFSPGQGTVAYGASHNPLTPPSKRSRRTPLERITPTIPDPSNLTTQSPTPGIQLQAWRRTVSPQTAKALAIAGGRPSRQDPLDNTEDGPRTIS